jgi:hypothetical protein
MPSSSASPYTLAYPVRIYPALLCCLLAVAASCPAGAQGRPPVPVPPASQGDAAAPHVSPTPAPHPAAPGHTRPRAPEPTAGHTLRLAPQGRWWDDRIYSRNLAIDSRQQRRMDQVFGSNRDQLLKLYTDLKREESQLDKLGKSASEPDLDRQIEKVAQARSELQKADTHMVLEIRRQLTPEQLSKMYAVK